MSLVNEKELEEYIGLKPRQKLFKVIVTAVGFLLSLLGYLIMKENDDEKKEKEAQ